MECKSTITIQLVGLSLVLCLTISFAVGAPGAASESSTTQEKSGPTTYQLADGRIEIKPRLKYEIPLSMHVLKTAEDHHQLFIPWAKRMRQKLSKKTLREAMILISATHEWGLGRFFEEYDGPDTIEGLAQYICKDNRQAFASVRNWKLYSQLGISHREFPEWYSEFLLRYYREGFESEWLAEQKSLVYQGAKDTARSLETLNFSLTTFMEEMTGRKFSGSSKIILYPSSFSRPQHAYGFKENGHKVCVFKIDGGKAGVISSIFHELISNI